MLALKAVNEFHYSEWRLERKIKTHYCDHTSYILLSCQNTRGICLPVSKENINLMKNYEVETHETYSCEHVGNLGGGNLLLEETHSVSIL